MGCGVPPRVTDVHEIHRMIVNSSLIKRNVSAIVKKAPFRGYTCEEIVKTANFFNDSFINKLDCSACGKVALKYLFKKTEIINKAELIMFFFVDNSEEYSEDKRSILIQNLRTLPNKGSKNDVLCRISYIATFFLEIFYFYVFAQIFADVCKEDLLSVLGETTITVENISNLVEFTKEELNKIEEFELTKVNF